MKILKMLAAVFLLLAVISGASAQETLRLYVEDGAMDSAQAQRLLAVLCQDAGDAQWTLESGERTLRELVLADCTPDLAICRPRTARPWAQEGMLLALHEYIPEQSRMQRQALDLCIYGEAMFMAPLAASHRQMAVNRTAFEQMGLEDMLDRRMYPVWYPVQFDQILEEFMIRDRTAADIWRAEEGSSAALEALTQAIHGGRLLEEDGETCRAGGEEMVAGVQWLADAVNDGLIDRQETREAALLRFLQGETAIFFDWTRALERQLEDVIRQKQLDIVTVPYPAAMGIPVRSFDLTGVCAFASGDTARDARLARACAALYAAAQDVLGPAGIWQDGAIWLPSLEGSDAGATLRGLMCAAINEAVETGGAEAALLRVQAVMDALGYAQ